jgi:hypothetical protein
MVEWDYKASIMELGDLDYQTAIDKVNSFFDELDDELKNINGKKVCILVDKSGTELFSEQKIRINCLRDALILNDTNGQNDKYICLKNNIAIVFDDAIKTGKTIIRVLDSILLTHPKMIIVVAIIASQNTLRFLKKKYGDEVIFKVSKKIHGDLDERNFDIEYHNSSNKILDAYIKYTCKPRQDKEIHPHLLIKLDNDVDGFFRTLERFDSIKDNDEGFKFGDRFIKSIVLEDEILQKMINQICFKEIKFNSDLDAFVRIFYRGDLKEVILQPVLRRHDDSYIINPSLLEARDYFIKLLIANYLVEYILSNVDNKSIKNICIKCHDKSVL